MILTGFKHLLHELVLESRLVRKGQFDSQRTPISRLPNMIRRITRRGGGGVMLPGPRVDKVRQTTHLGELQDLMSIPGSLFDWTYRRDAVVQRRDGDAAYG